MLAVILAAVASLVLGGQTASFRAPVNAVTTIAASVDRDWFKLHTAQEPMRAGLSRAHRANPIVASHPLVKSMASVY